MVTNKKSILRKARVPLIVVIAVAVLFVIPASRDRIIDLFSLGGPPMESGVYYTCPMHPDIRLPQMGDCPICGMSLVKKAAGEDDQSGSITVTPQQAQLTGVTVAPVTSRSLYKEIDTYGKIDYDETKLGVVSAWVGGRIDQLFIDFTGVTINKGHPLVKLYSPEIISSEREYLLALENLERVRGSGFEEATRNAEELVKSTRQRLLWLGLSEKQLDQIATSKTFDQHILIYAPRGGTVIEKKAYPGMYVKEGDVLFNIADLSRVWLYADIYEDEMPFLFQERPGDYFECAMHPEVQSPRPGSCRKCGMDLTRANRSITVEITTRAFPGDTFEGYISFTDPFLNPETRTVRVRVNIDNPDLRLKPGMFARARIRLPAGEMLAAPESAVIHSGTRKIVLVEERPGKFKPKLVKLGRLWLSGEDEAGEGEATLAFRKGSIRYHEVLAGLEVGEKVVTSGNFLVGSESQLQGALAKMMEESEQPSGEEETAAPSIDPATLGKEEKNFAPLLDAYFGIGDKLAHDTIEGIPELARKIADAAQNESIRKAAEPLTHANHKQDITIVRQDFRRLSNLLIAYIDVHKAHMDKKPFKIYCPMADASWLQAEKTVENPYYGASMLRCGNVESWDG